MIVLLFYFGRTFILIVQTDAGGNARIGTGHVAGIYVIWTIVVGCNICIEGRVGGHCNGIISKMNIGIWIWTTLVGTWGNRKSIMIVRFHVPLHHN